MKITLLPGDGIGVEIVDAKNITLPLNTIKN